MIRQKSKYNRKNPTVTCLFPQIYMKQKALKYFRLGTYVTPQRPGSDAKLFMSQTLIYPYIFCNLTVSKLQKMYGKIEVFLKLITDFFALQI